MNGTVNGLRGRCRSNTPTPVLNTSPLKSPRPYSQEASLFEAVRCRICDIKLSYFRSDKFACFTCGAPVCDLHCKRTRITRENPKSRRWCQNCEVASAKQDIRRILENEISALNAKIISTKEDCDRKTRENIALSSKVAEGCLELEKAEEGYRAKVSAKSSAEQVEKDRQQQMQKELQFYEDQTKTGKVRRETLLSDVEKALWRVQTLEAEKQETKMKEELLQDQLAEAARKVKATLSLSKLKESVCRGCHARLCKVFRDDRSLPMMLPLEGERVSMGASKEEDKCSLL